MRLADRRYVTALEIVFRRAMSSIGVVLLLCVVVGIPGVVFAGNLFGIGNTALNPIFCKQRTFRTTVVYIDDMMMRKGQTHWASSLADKLRATLTPGERVTVVQLSPSRGTSREIWSGCWPDYSAAQRARLAGQSHFFSGSPLDAVKSQQKVFMNEFGGALTKIYSSALRQPLSTKISGSNPPKKYIIESLASDGARFAQSAVTIRALVYSDLAENSDIGSVFVKPMVLPKQVGKALGIYLRGSVFYFFGVGVDVHGASGYLRRTRKFWTAAVTSMQGTIEGFGSDLNVPNRVPVASYRYSLVLERRGHALFGRASFLVDNDGNLIDSWVGISRLTFVGVTGVFHCVMGVGGCVLQARTDGGLATNSPTESIDLTGSRPKKLQGTIGVKGALVFPLVAKLDTN